MFYWINFQQLFNIQNISEIFNKNGIDFMPLKGAVLKNIYPMPEMRTMGDIDILFREKDKEKIVKLMQENGYAFLKESDHEVVFECVPTAVELHKRLIPSYNLDYNEYYKDSWRFAKPVKNNEYAMSNEDFFVYIFTHFAKHYRDKGAGIKYIVDFYVYLKKFPDLDKKYIESELEKLKLLKFYENIIKLIGVWFYGEEEDETSTFLTDKIFTSGVYGRSDNAELSRLLKSSKKNKHYRFIEFMRLIFPTKKDMKDLYPVLKKHIILLPWFYFVRIISKLISPKKTKKAVKTVKMLKGSPSEIKKYRSELNYVGLDYNFYDEKTEKEN